MLVFVFEDAPIPEMGRVRYLKVLYWGPYKKGSYYLGGGGGGAILGVPPKVPIASKDRRTP